MGLKIPKYEFHSENEDILAGLHQNKGLVES